MNSRLPSTDKIDVMMYGEANARFGIAWRDNPETDPRLRREWLRGWIREALGDAISRHIAKSDELIVRHLERFHVEQRPKRDPFKADEFELVEVARAMTPPVPWMAIAAALGRDHKSLSVTACRRGLTRKPA